MHLLFPELFGRQAVLLRLLDRLPALPDLRFVIQRTGDSHPLRTNIVVPDRRRAEPGVVNVNRIAYSWEGGWGSAQCWWGRRLWGHRGRCSRQSH